VGGESTANPEIERPRLLQGCAVIAAAGMLIPSRRYRLSRSRSSISSR
jgi:hypothetical protein